MNREVDVLMMTENNFFNLERYGDQPFLIDESSKSFSYQEIALMGDQSVCDIPSGSLVFFLCSNTIWSISAYFGLLRKKCVPLLLDENLDKDLLERMIACYQPTFVLGEKNQAQQPFAGDDIGIHSKLALLLSTSGSTGDPKLVRLSAGNLQSNAESIVQYLGIDASQRAVTSLPMHYTYGLSIIHSYAQAGASLYITNRTMFEPEFWDGMRRYRVTSLSGVPYNWQMLKRLKLTEMDLPDLKVLTQAGGKLPEDLQAFFGKWAQETGRSFFVMYGQTEATARMSYLPPDRCLEKIGSIGIAIPGGSFSLEEGELVYAGPNVSMGYAQCREDLSKGDDNQGVLHTGDLAYQDEDGYYYIAGRKKRFVKLYGKRISLDAVENLLKQAFPEIDAACAGSDDGIRIWIAGGNIQENLSEQNQIKQRTRQYLCEKTGLKMKDIEVCLIDYLPRTESGKIQYYKL